jgi:PAS domain S-box-containing protein
VSASSGRGQYRSDTPAPHETALAQLAQAQAILTSLQAGATANSDGSDLHFIDTLSSAVSLALENARLYEEQRATARLNEALVHIDTLIRSTLDADQIMREVVVEAGRVLGSESSAVDLREGGKWIVHCVCGLPEEVVGVTFDDEDTPFMELAMQTKSVVAIDDAHADLRVRPEIMARYGLASVLVAPLESKGSVTGMLFFNYHSHAVSFRESEIEFARKVAASMSLGLENARLLKELERERLQLQTVLARAPEGIVVADAEANILFANAAADKLYRHPLDSTSGGVQLKGREIHTADGLPLDERLLPLARAALDGETVTDTEFRICWPDGLYRYLLASAAPIRTSDGANSGAVCVFQDITERKERERLTQALNELSTVINSTLDPEEVMQRVVEEAAQAMGAASAALMLLEAGEWSPRQVYGLPKECQRRRFSDAERVRVAEALPGVRSTIEVPLILHDRVTGVLAFYYLESPIALSAPREDFARRLAAQISIALDTAFLFEEQKKISQTLQKALLNVPQTMQGAIFGHLHRPVSIHADVGGDFYDLFPLREGRMGVLIGDVTGRGAEAAARATCIRQSMKAYASEERSPARVLEKTNRLLMTTEAPGFLATAFMGVLTPGEGIIEYASAGHPPALLRGPDGHVTSLAKANLPLGLFGEVEYQGGSVPLTPSDVLLVYTDGVIEARRGREAFGHERLRELLAAPGGESPEMLPDRIMNAVTAFAGNQLRDDAAVLAVALTGS